jgi:outer membrane protein TolC
LYAGGRYTTTLRLAEINLSRAQSQYDAARNKVTFEIKKSFNACLTACKKTQAYEETLKEVKSLEAKGGAGGARWSAFRVKLELNLLEAKHTYEKCLLRFLETAGIELNTLADVKGETGFPQGDYDLNKCLAWAFQARPELRQTQFEETIDSLRVNLSLTERYPTVTLGANYEWVGAQFPLADNKNRNATLNFNVPIFDGWASWSRIKQRRNQAREGKIRRAKIEDQIRFEVREAYMDYNFWRGQVLSLDNLPLADMDPEKRLEYAIARLDAQQKAIESQAALEWAVGQPLK